MAYATIRGQLLELERQYTAPPALVWKALVDPRDLERWLFARVELDLRVGGTILFEFLVPPYAKPVATITRLDPGSLLEYRWSKHNAPSLLCWQVAAAPDGGSLLALRQTLESGDILDLAAGWHYHLDVMRTLVDSDAPTPPSVGFAELRAEYERRATATATGPAGLS